MPQVPMYQASALLEPGTAPLRHGRADQRCTDIASLVAAVFGVSMKELYAGSRGRARVAFARQVAMYLAHVAFGISLTRVAQLFGRDRSTARHACHLVEDHRDDPTIDRLLTALELCCATGNVAPQDEQAVRPCA